jgi:hypothetical protein
VTTNAPELKRTLGLGELGLSIRGSGHLHTKEESSMSSDPGFSDVPGEKYVRLKLGRSPLYAQSTK